MSAPIISKTKRNEGEFPREEGAQQEMPSHFSKAFLPRVYFE